MNPYRGLPDEQFWSRAITFPQHGHIDPVSKSRLITPSQKVATLGSCFAQHIAREIQASGLNYFVPEQPPDGWSATQAAANNYGTFSARYGNVYTVRQALQLFDRAFGRFVPAEPAWSVRGGFVDPFRPRIDSDPKASIAEVQASTAEHLASVRRVFMEADWLVFTLGLTEAWRSKDDGAVFPLAPGVAGGVFDETKYEFVNFTVDEIRDDLDLLIQQVRRVNPSLTILLTVSPVSLIATYEPRHVLQSTVYSKAVLRVAADEIERRHDKVLYFPSFEIITSPAAGGHYYQDDLREVTPVGVAHVMRVFNRHFVGGAIAKPSRLSANDTTATQIVCDEEVIKDALRQAGYR